MKTILTLLTALLIPACETPGGRAGLSVRSDGTAGLTWQDDAMRAELMRGPDGKTVVSISRSFGHRSGKEPARTDH